MVEEKTAGSSSDDEGEPDEGELFSAEREEENFSDLDLYDIKEKIKLKFRIEHYLILILVLLLIWAIIDRQSLINKCNSYWIAEMEKITNSFVIS